MSSSYKTLNVTRSTDDLIVTVELFRPEALNAMNTAMGEELLHCFDRFTWDRTVRAVVFTGAGEKAFCVGSDIKEIARTGSMASTKTLMDALPGVGIPLDKPVIAALHGFCVGMGMTLALHCDLRLAAKNTVLGYPEVKHGMISGVSAMRLPQVIPQAKALEMLLLGRNMTVDEAVRIGLVNAVVDDVQAEARAWAEVIASYSPVAVQATKRLALFPQRLSEAEKAEITAVRDAVESKDDFKQGATAFTKRA